MKSVEKVIYARLHHHMKSNDISVNEQYGFRNNSSAEKASCKLINEILNSLNNNTLVGGTFCDLKKAFDCINYYILLSNWFCME
jgi:hypothetical protein